MSQKSKENLDRLRCEVLTHPSCLPDIAPGEYHLFRPVENALPEQRSNFPEDIDS